MSVEMKLGRWISGSARVRNVDESVVTEDGQHYLETSTGMRWDEDGCCMTSLCDLDDLIEYLGPIELSPTPACAEAGPAGDPQTVSTEDPQESLRRMRAQWNALCREESAYGEALLGVQKAKGNLEEAIKLMEKEVEG